MVFHVGFSCELEEHLGLRATRHGCGGRGGGGLRSALIERRQALFMQGGGGEAVKGSQGAVEEAHRNKMFQLSGLQPRVRCVESSKLRVEQRLGQGFTPRRSHSEARKPRRERNLDRDLNPAFCGRVRAKTVKKGTPPRKERRRSCAHGLTVSRELSDASSQLQALECLEHRSAGGHTRRGLNGEVNLSRGVTRPSVTSPSVFV